MIDDLNLCESFINCSFINNTAYSKYCIAYGGAIFYLKSYRSEASISFKSNELLQNLTFINNTSYSGNSFSCGGAIAYEVSIFYPYQKVIQNRLFECLNFINNTALSKSSKSQGGAICFIFFYSDSSIFKQNGTIFKSTFTNNTAISSSSYS